MEKVGMVWKTCGGQIERLTHLAPLAGRTALRAGVARACIARGEKRHALAGMPP